eukprot:gb/GECH01012736.1/.p1 GENE.gb/GECH01012736.1/~~gb/GECH01012736.1/.p1  ORF type:complete len:236 (+),score=31.89 gb/GECH01012736.1/:1-708(+)
MSFLHFQHRSSCLLAVWTFLVLTVVLTTLPYRTGASLDIVQDQPLFQRPPGYPSGQLGSPVTVELVGDLTCIDTKEFWEKTFQPVLQTFSSSVYFLFHQFPLPYHIAGFDTAQAAEVVDKYSNKNFLDFADYVFENQNGLYNDKVNSTNQNQLWELLYKNYVSKFNVNHSTFFQEMNNRNNNLQVRYQFKYAASRGVTGTPTLFVNGVKLTDIGQYDQTKLIHLLKELINQRYHS